MTKRYTAADFANAQFAKHEASGDLATRDSGDSVYGWRTWGQGFASDARMAESGWVPVPTKPQITESQVNKELAGETKDFKAGFHYALAVLETKIIPDREPTNTERLGELIADYYDDLNDPEPSLQQYLNDHGVTAPNVKDN